MPSSSPSVPTMASSLGWPLSGTAATPLLLAPSSHGAMMVVFCNSDVREATLRLGSIEMGGRILRLVRHEDAEFRFICHYRRRVELAVTNFPPEHWAPERIDTAFSALGQVCCIDQSCLVVVDELLGGGIADYSAVRVVILVDAGWPVP